MNGSLHSDTSLFRLGYAMGGREAWMEANQMAMPKLWERALSLTTLFQFFCASISSGYVEIRVMGC
jgi:hypothetical protein